eukprot:scaffold2629_cov152-Amphora_coffeaeformis.AAC.3
MIPRCAVAANPAAYVTGVEMVNAQGQAITMRISPRRHHSCPVWIPHNQGTVHKTLAMATTAGVYARAKESIIFSVSDVFVCASSTKRMRRLTVESATLLVV